MSKKGEVGREEGMNDGDERRGEAGRKGGKELMTG